MHQLLKQNWSEIINGSKKYCDSKNKSQERIISFFTPIRHSYNRSWNKSLLLNGLLFIEAQHISVLKNKKAAIMLTKVYFSSTHRYLIWHGPWIPSIFQSYSLMHSFLPSAISWDHLEMFFRDYLHFTFQWLSRKERKRKCWVEGIELKNVSFWTKNNHSVCVCIYVYIYKPPPPLRVYTYVCVCVYIYIYIHIRVHLNLSSV